MAPNKYLFLDDFFNEVNLLKIKLSIYLSICSTFGKMKKPSIFDKTASWHCSLRWAGFGKHQRACALIHLPTRSSAAHDLTRSNICPGVQSPRKDISWTLIWDYSQKLRQDEQGLLSPPVTFIWQEHGMITPRVLSS